MSKVIDCPDCGKPMEVPAFEGDGVYSVHVCEPHKCKDRGGMFFAECACGKELEPYA